MGKFEALAPEHQDALRKKYPDWDSNSESWKDNAVGMFQRKLNKRKNASDAKARKATAAIKEDTAAPRLSANPTEFHRSLYKGMEALENVANDHPNQNSMQPVFDHLENARASLREHWNAHHDGDVEVAAGHLQNAATHIGNAATALHIISPIPGGAAPIADHVKTVADGYKYGYAGGRAKQVKSAKYDTQLGDMADAGLKTQQEKERKSAKAWEAYAKNADKKLPPRVSRVTPEEQQARAAESLNLTRQMRAAAPRDEQGRLAVTAADKLEASSKRNASPAPSVSAEYTSGAQKYTGTLAKYGKNSTVGVPFENREEYFHHAKIASAAIQRGQQIPQETVRALGTHGIAKVHASLTEKLISPTTENNLYEEPRSRGGRGGSLEEFATGRA